MTPDDINELIRKRRTVKPKQYSAAPVDESLIHQMLENANWAPTHGMTEPWRFVVFSGDSRAVLGEFLSSTYRKITDDDSFKQNKFDSFRENPGRAPYVIAIVMKRQESGRIPEVEEIEAVACAVQNMHLTAAAYGLGAFWSSNKAAVSDEMREFLGFDAGDRVLGLFYVGNPAGDWPESTRQPIAEKVQWRR